MVDSNLEGSAVGMGQTGVHDICDDYERDRQSSPDVSMRPYIERAPDSVKNWILKELMAIEIDISEEPPDRDVLLASAGVPSKIFDLAWEKLQEELDPDPSGSATEAGTRGTTRIGRRRRASNVTAVFQNATQVAAEAFSAKNATDESADVTKLSGMVADDFELLDLLGEGGMGMVCRAYQHSLQRSRPVGTTCSTPSLRMSRMRMSRTTHRPRSTLLRRAGRILQISARLATWPSSTIWP